MGYVICCGLAFRETHVFFPRDLCLFLQDSFALPADDCSQPHERHLEYVIICAFTLNFVEISLWEASSLVSAIRSWEPETLERQL